MYKHDELEVIPNKIVKIFNDLQEKLMLDIVRKLKLANEIGSSTDYQIEKLRKLGVSQKEINQYLKKALDITDKELNELYNKVIEKGYVRDKELYTKTGVDFIEFKDNTELQQLIKSVSDITNGEIDNITKSLGFVTGITGNRVVELSDYYTKKLNQAVLELATGSFNYSQTITYTVNEMVKSGIRYIDYESGYHNRIDVAVRRAVMSGLNQITNKTAEDNMARLKTDFVEVSYHSTARPTHQVWQGRVYTKDELVTVCGLGTVTGLLGANCYHHYDAFIPGVSKRNYTDEELDLLNHEANKKVSFEKNSYTKYEATQKQRQLERNLKAMQVKMKLLKEAGEKETYTELKVKYKKTFNYYKDFSEATGLKLQMERVLAGAI